MPGASGVACRTGWQDAGVSPGRRETLCESRERAPQDACGACPGPPCPESLRGHLEDPKCDLVPQTPGMECPDFLGSSVSGPHMCGPAARETRAQKQTQGVRMAWPGPSPTLSNRGFQGGHHQETECLRRWRGRGDRGCAEWGAPLPPSSTRALGHPSVSPRQLSWHH